MPNVQPTRSSSAFPQRRNRRARPTSLTLFSAAAPCGEKQSASGASSPIPEVRDVKPGAGLTGIARLAALSPLAEQKRGTEYFVLPVRSILNHCDSDRVPFAWTVNPYRGCEFGCQYCYARYTHEFMELDSAEFERKIFVKENAGERMERDLATKKVRGEHIAIGTATDPYQPAESEFGATRAVLERAAEREGLSYSITTKSDRILRDLDLLRAVAARNTLFVNMTVITMRPGLARLLEPRAPRPDLRMRALQRLREAGITAGVNMMPMLPGITDREQDMDAVAREAKAADAQWIAIGTLFLMSASMKNFLPFIERKFPRLAKQYRDWYGKAAYGPDAYLKEMSARAAKLRQKYGLNPRPDVSARLQSPEPQFCLGLR